MANTSNITLEHLGLFNGDDFRYFATIYDPIHVPLSLTICLLGVLANALNVIVLTRRSMITATNAILTGLSAAQLFLLINYLLLLIFNICATTCLAPVLHSYPSVTYKWINVNLSVAFHATAFGHTLLLAIFRFLAIQFPAFARTHVTVRNARIFVTVIHSIIPILCSPTFFTSHVAPAKPDKPRDTCGLIDAYDLDYAEDPIVLKLAMWTYGIFFKLVPSLLILILSLYLIVSLKRYNERKNRLKGKYGRVQYTRSTDTTSQRRMIRTWTTDTDLASNLIKTKSPYQTDRIKKTGNSRRTPTKMLIAVALLCVSVELPHGVVNLLTAMFGQEFATEVYDNLGDLFEMLTLLYSSVNFILYCAMSKEFQRTFWKMFGAPVWRVCVRKGHVETKSRPCVL